MLSCSHFIVTLNHVCLHRGKTMGVVGYGDIGQACARLGRAFGMHILALRRRTELSDQEQQSGLKVCELAPFQRPFMLVVSSTKQVCISLTAVRVERLSGVAASKPDDQSACQAWQTRGSRLIDQGCHSQ